MRALLLGLLLLAAPAWASLDIIETQTGIITLTTEPIASFDCDTGDAFTVEAHFRLNGIAEGTRVHYLWSSWEQSAQGLWLAVGGTAAPVYSIKCNCDNTVNTQTAALTVAETYSAACVFCGSSTTGDCTAGNTCAYLDGVLLGCGGTDASTTTMTEGYLINNVNGTTSTLDLTIEEIRQWTVQKSADDLADNDHCEIADDADQLRSVWHLDDFTTDDCTTNTSVVDSSASLADNDGVCSTAEAVWGPDELIDGECGTTTTTTSTTTSTTLRHRLPPVIF